MISEIIGMSEGGTHEQNALTRNGWVTCKQTLDAVSLVGSMTQLAAKMQTTPGLL